MSNELKICPFCGWKMAYLYHGNETTVRCPSCRAQITRETREEAIEAWNARYEPTCRYEVSHRKLLGGKDVAVSKCSNCGSAIYYCDIPPSGYCSRCGHKIVNGMD